MSKKQELAVQETANTAIALATDYGQMAGDGFDNVDRNHVSLPFINLLQALSPEIAGSGGELVDGAKIGMLINSVTKELFTSVIVQPVMVRESFVEWQPDRGGKVAEHLPESKEVADAKRDAGPEGWNDLRIGDNVLTQTFYMLALLHRSGDIAEQSQTQPEPVMFSLAVTKVRPYRAIMTRLASCAIGGKRPPLFAHRLLVTTTPETNKAGQPYKGIKFSPLVENNVAKSLIPATEVGLLETAKALAKAYNAGTAKPVDEVTRGIDTGPI